MKEKYSRGQLAKLTGVNAETIRFYENKGLLQEPARSSGGHRVYSAENLKQLNFLHRCRELGFSLLEISELLLLSDNSPNACGSVKEMTVKHISDIQQKIRDLKKMKKSLNKLITECDNDSENCAIIEALFHDQ